LLAEKLLRTRLFGDFLRHILKRCLKLCLSLVNSPQAITRNAEAVTKVKINSNSKQAQEWEKSRHQPYRAPRLASRCRRPSPPPTPMLPRRHLAGFKTEPPFPPKEKQSNRRDIQQYPDYPHTAQNRVSKAAKEWEAARGGIHQPLLRVDSYLVKQRIKKQYSYCAT
jgi:hypothetical protein